MLNWFWNRRLSFLTNFMGGFLVGAVFVCLLGAVIDQAFWRAESQSWTNFAAILVAAFAAAVTLQGTLLDIEIQSRRDKENRQADLAAAKAVLPLALNTVADVALKGFDFSLENDEFYRDIGNLKLARETLELNDAVLSAFRDCIKSAKPEARDWLAAIIQRYQTCYATLIGNMSEPGLLPLFSNKTDNAAQWSVLRAMVLHTFAYSRNESEDIGKLSPAKIDIPQIGKFSPYGQGQETSRRIEALRGTFGDGSASNYFTRMRG